MVSKIIPCFLSVCVIALFISGCKKDAPASAVITTDVNPALPVITDPNFYFVSGNDTSSTTGEILMALNSKTDGKLIFIDQRGSLIREKSVGTDVENLQKWNISGQVRYTYFHTSGVSTLDGITGTELGYEIICDSGLNILDTVKLLSYNNINTAVQDKVDVHEFILLGDNHYICETYYEETPTNIPDSVAHVTGVKVAACIIQEINNGQVVFQWDGGQVVELYASSQENNDFTDTTTVHDYMHLNSICIDSADNNLVVSFRNLDEIVKLNRQTGQIIWRLGGSNSDFLQTPDQQFLRQHYPRFTDNGKTLIFVDNGDATLRPYTRIDEFQLNEAAKTITSFKGYNIPTRFIQFAGSVKKEGNQYFIGGGEANYAAAVDYTTNQVLMQLTSSYPSYRALKY